MGANLTQIKNFKHNFYRDLNFKKKLLIKTVQTEKTEDASVFFRIVISFPLLLKKMFLLWLKTDHPFRRPGRPVKCFIL